MSTSASCCQRRLYVTQAETDAYIIERVKAVLHVLKYCQSEEARIEYGILLAALAPERLASGDHKGMIKQVAERLSVQRGTRSFKSTYYEGRYTRELEPRPFDQGITRRAAFDVGVSANARAKAQGHARKLAGQLERSLKDGRILIAVQNRGEDDEDQYFPFHTLTPVPY